MLFLGTEKYPDEKSYKEYLTSNGGSANAYTSMEHTNYYFSVNSRALNGALDRFSEFFKSPLFTPSATMREMNAVDSGKLHLLCADWAVLFAIPLFMPFLF